jgi:hypothetical protein
MPHKNRRKREWVDLSLKWEDKNPSNAISPASSDSTDSLSSADSFSSSNPEIDSINELDIFADKFEESLAKFDSLNFGAIDPAFQLQELLLEQEENKKNKSKKHSRKKITRDIEDISETELTTGPTFAKEIDPYTTRPSFIENNKLNLATFDKEMTTGPSFIEKHDDKTTGPSFVESLDKTQKKNALAKANRLIASLIKTPEKHASFSDQEILKTPSVEKETLDVPKKPNSIMKKGSSISF